MRGPLGGWFVWRPDDPGPVLLVAGGSGVVPLMAMIRARAGVSRAPFRLVYSVRTPDDRIYAAELRRRAAEDGGLDVTYVYTREAPADSPRPPGRIRADDLVAARLAARLRADLLRVRPDAAGRGGGRPARRLGTRPRTDPDRAVRRLLTVPRTLTQRRGRTMTQTETTGPYDGNALAGPLSEVFALEVTAAVARCRGCGRSSPGRDARRLRAGARAGRPLPRLLRRPAARRTDAGRGLAGPRRDQRAALRRSGDRGLFTRDG